MLIQIFVTIFVLFAFSRAYIQFRDNRISIGNFLFWMIVWASVLVLIYWPRFFDRMAELFDIQRTIDALVYFSILFLLYLIFRSYVKIQELEEGMTQMIRKIALKNIIKKS